DRSGRWWLAAWWAIRSCSSSTSRRRASRNGCTTSSRTSFGLEPTGVPLWWWSPTIRKTSTTWWTASCCWGRARSGSSATRSSTQRDGRREEHPHLRLRAPRVPRGLGGGPHGAGHRDVPGAAPALAHRGRRGPPRLRRCRPGAAVQPRSLVGSPGGGPGRSDRARAAPNQRTTFRRPLDGAGVLLRDRAGGGGPLGPEPIRRVGHRHPVRQRVHGLDVRSRHDDRALRGGPRGGRARVQGAAGRGPGRGDGPSLGTSGGGPERRLRGDDVAPCRCRHAGRRAAAHRRAAGRAGGRRVQDRALVPRVDAHGDGVGSDLVDGWPAHRAVAGAHRPRRNHRPHRVGVLRALHGLRTPCVPPASEEGRRMKAEGTLIDAAGLRPTRQRIAILRAVATERRPVTAQDLYARLRGARGSPGLATIYRTLGALTEAGILRTFPAGGGEVAYRLCDPGHHHHLICEV